MYRVNFERNNCDVYWNYLSGRLWLPREACARSGREEKAGFCLSEVQLRGRRRRNREEAYRERERKRARGSGIRERKGTFTKPIHPPTLANAETLIPTGWRCPPTTRRQWILCGQKSVKEKERERGPPPARGENERKSGNDESIVPVQRLFCEPSRRSVGLYLLQLCRNHGLSPIYRLHVFAHLRLSLAKTTTESDRLRALSRPQISREVVPCARVVFPNQTFMKIY